MTEREELYRFEVILYKDSAEFSINFPKPHPFIVLPSVWMGEDESFMNGLQVKGWEGIMTIRCSKPKANEDE